MLTIIMVLYKFRVAIMGGGGVGKSCITARFVHNIFIKKYDPTIEDIYTKVFDYDDETHIHMEICDTAGTEQFSATRLLYITDSDGIFVCYAINNISSLYDLDPLLDKIKKIKLTKSKTGKLPHVIILANKCDLTQRIATIEKFEEEYGEEYDILETSAKTDINIFEAFHKMIERLIDLKPKKKNVNKCIVL
jgi:small GTP-binding protein